jgi:hypothetical protein
MTPRRPLRPRLALTAGSGPQFRCEFVEGSVPTASGAGFGRDTGVGERDAGPVVDFVQNTVTSVVLDVPGGIPKDSGEIGLPCSSAIVSVYVSVR